ncbi:hypothetical protein FRC06_005123, partial [Ceratobasidium sp. 370]
MGQMYYYKLINNIFECRNKKIWILEGKWNRKGRFVIQFAHDTPTTDIKDTIPDINKALNLTDGVTYSRATTWSKVALLKVPTGAEHGCRYSKEELLKELTLNDAAAMLEITQGL